MKSMLTCGLLLAEAAICLAQDDGRYHSTVMYRPAVASTYEDDGQYHATAPNIVAAESKVDARPEVWLFTADGDWCTHCTRAKDEIDPVWDDLPFRVVYKTEVPEWLDGHVDTLPTTYWIAGKSGKKLAGWHGLKGLTAAWSATMPKVQAPKSEVPKPKIAAVVFGPQYFVNGHNTPVSHLTNEHHVPYSVIEPYRNNPVALNRIHGAVHTGMVRY